MLHVLADETSPCAARARAFAAPSAGLLDRMLSKTSRRVRAARDGVAITWASLDCARNAATTMRSTRHDRALAVTRARGPGTSKTSDIDFSSSQFVNRRRPSALCAKLVRLSGVYGIPRAGDYTARLGTVQGEPWTQYALRDELRRGNEWFALDALEIRYRSENGIGRRNRLERERKRERRHRVA